MNALRNTNNTTALFALILISSTVLIDYTYNHLVINTTQSLPERLFWLTNSKSSDAPPNPKAIIKTGGYAVFTFDHPSITKPLIKKVACNQGDSLTQQAERFYCNGNYLVSAKAVDGFGLTPFKFNGEIPQGSFFAIGTHPESVDSRYFGLVKHSAAQAATPLF